MESQLSTFFLRVPFSVAILVTGFLFHVSAMAQPGWTEIPLPVTNQSLFYRITGTITTYTNISGCTCGSYYLQDGTGGLNIFVTGQNWRPAMGDVVTAVGFLSPPLLLPDQPPLPTPSGWLFHLDAPNLLLTGLRPAPEPR